MPAMENIERVRESGFDPIRFIDDIAKVSRADSQIPDPEAGVGRKCFAFSEQEDRANEVAERSAREILRVREEGREYNIERDAIGNLYITFFGEHPQLPAIITISHLDSVDNGGKYDGVAGVAAALDILQVLAKRREKPQRNYRVAVFRSEESSPRNGVGCLGSSVATGTISPGALHNVTYEGDTPLEIAFSARYGADRWNAVQDQLAQHKITPENTAASFELHIEQSSVIAMNDSGMAIVVGGIGGAWRERVTKEPVRSEVISTPEGSYKRLTLEFHGTPDHTGGTPPNPAFFNAGGSMLYRKDALVASGFVLNHLLRSKEISVLRSETARDTGYTSVPSHHVVELLVPASTDLSKTLLNLTAQAKEGFGVTLEAREEAYQGVSAQVVASDRVRQLLNIPSVVAALSTKAWGKEALEYGSTRATVTDYHLTPDGLSYKLDMRDVNTEDRDELLGRIRSRAATTIGKDPLSHVSHKEHQPVDAGLVERLKGVAREQNVPFIEMPSLPGHDSDRIAAAGIPAAMVLVRQNDGVSHNPRERMEDDHFSVGSRVIKETVLKMLDEPVAA